MKLCNSLERNRTEKKTKVFVGHTSAIGGCKGGWRGGEPATEPVRMSVHNKLITVVILKQYKQANTSDPSHTRCEGLTQHTGTQARWSARATALRAAGDLLGGSATARS